MRLGGFLAAPACAWGALAALVLEVAQSSSICTSAVHALLCMASLFASTNYKVSTSSSISILFINSYGLMLKVRNQQQSTI